MRRNTRVEIKKRRQPRLSGSGKIGDGTNFQRGSSIRLAKGPKIALMAFSCKKPLNFLWFFIKILHFIKQFNQNTIKGDSMKINDVSRQLIDSHIFRYPDTSKLLYFHSPLLLHFPFLFLSCLGLFFFLFLYFLHCRGLDASLAWLFNSFHTFLDVFYDPVRLLFASEAFHRHLQSDSIAFGVFVAFLKRLALFFSGGCCFKVVLLIGSLHAAGLEQRLRFCVQIALFRANNGSNEKGIK